VQVYHQTTTVDDERLGHGGPVVETHLVLYGPLAHEWTPLDVPTIAYLRTSVSIAAIASSRKARAFLDHFQKHQGIPLHAEAAYILDPANGRMSHADATRLAIAQHDRTVEAVRAALDAALAA